MYQEILRGFSGDVNSLLRKFHWQRSYVPLGEVSCEVQKFVENYMLLFVIVYLVVISIYVCLRS